MTDRKYLPTDYQQFIATSRYSRWMEELGRRETWEEAVGRYFRFWKDRYPDLDLSDCQEAVLNLEVFPSMRALMTAGEALERDNVAGFNCAFIAIDHSHAFDEVLYTLCCGTGVGFSVEAFDVNKLPEIPWEFHNSESVIVVPDSKIGWATSFRELISMLYAGKLIKWDISRVRPKGSRLKTFGGRASGPEPLVELFKFTVNLFTKAAGRKLRPIECHDLVCKIAEIVVVGGVRRSALISLSDLADIEMRDAKAGRWWEQDGQRALSNNSAVYDQKPSMGQFIEEWTALYKSGSGERGIFNRHAAKKYISDLPERQPNHRFGTNPCGEILLRSAEFCNLTSVQVSPDDDVKSLKKKVRIATILGTLQSSLTDFRYLRKIWKKNCEEERLEGVSLSGICDNPLLSNHTSKDLPGLLDKLSEYAHSVNEEYAAKIGINPSVAITCIKPEGTTSQLSNRASGIHPRYSPYYIRTVRSDAKDPITRLMQDQGIPWEPDVTKPNDTVVFSFPIKSPEGSVMRDDMTAIDQLELWLVYKKYWADHTVSCTVYVREDEWLKVASWVYEHFDDISGVSFLPHSDHTYRQAPYQACTKEEYDAFLEKMPKAINWAKLSEYELEDATAGSHELACSGPGGCELK